MSYPSGSSSLPPSPSPQPRRGPQVPVWLPIAAGIAVIAVAALVVVMVAGRDTKSATSTTSQAGTSSTTAADTTTTTAGATSTTSSPDEPGGSWTVLVYGLGDNNLEEDLLRDLEEMAAVPPAALQFVSLVDRTPDYSDADLPGVGNWDTAKLIAISPGSFAELEDLGELNLGDPQVLADFVARGIQLYPADHYALILWDHGSIAGVGSDESSGDGLSVPEIAAGTRAGLDQAGVARLDLLGFDACLMGAFEVAARMTGVTDYMVGSEEVEPSTGWDYSAFDLLAAQPDQVTARSLGEEIVARYVTGTGANDPTVTMSLLDLRHMDDLVTAMATLNGNVGPAMTTFAPAIGQGRNQAPSFGGSPIPEEDFFMVDLGDLLRRWSEEEAPLGDAADAALVIFDRVVVASDAGSAFPSATGLAVYFPPYSEYYYPYEDWYLATEAPVWPDFLNAYYTAGAAIPEGKRPSFAPVDNLASFYFDDYGLNVEAAFDSAAVGNIVEAVLYTGVVEPDGTVTFVGEDQGVFEGNQAAAMNDLTRLLLDDGQDQAYAYQDISFNEDLTFFTLEVPLAYYAPGAAPGGDDYRDITLRLTYDATTEEFNAGFYSADEFGTVSEFTTDPTGLIVPWMLTWYPDGTIEWVQTTDVGLWADLSLLSPSYPKLDPGTSIYAELYVFDYGGHSDFATVEAVIPATETAWATCANTTYGYQVSYPGDYYVWDSPTPDLDCAYFDLASLEGLTEVEAFDQAALTVEVYEAADFADVQAFFEENSVIRDEATVAGSTAVLYESGREEWGYRAYAVPLDGGRTLLIAAWGQVDQSLTDRADRVAASLVLGG